jgi:hypothetical protein
MEAISDTAIVPEGPFYLAEREFARRQDLGFWKVQALSRTGLFRESWLPSSRHFGDF